MVDPIEIETSDATSVTVEYGDETYMFPASLDDADGDVLDAVDDQKLSHALRGLMGDDDWQKFKATRPTVRDYGGLFTAYAKVIGLPTAGE